MTWEIVIVMVVEKKRLGENIRKIHYLKVRTCMEIVYEGSEVYMQHVLS